MSDTKRMLFAGLLIALLTLTIPFYLQMIGVEQKTPSPELVSDVPLKEKTDNKTFLDNDTILPILVEEDRNYNIDIVSFTVQTEQFVAVLSNYNGGTLSDFSILGDGAKAYQYVGGYNEMGNYDEEAPVNLFHQLNEGCFPCLTVEGPDNGTNHYWDIKKISLFENGFSRDVMGYSSILLNNADSLLINMSLHLDGSSGNQKIINKTTTIYNAGFLIQHHYKLANINADFSVVWSGGIKPTERNLTEEGTYSQAFIAQNKDIDDVSLAPSTIDDVVDKTYKRGPTDWVAVRNKYFINALVSNDADGGFVGGHTEFLNVEKDILIPVFDVGLSFRNSNSVRVNQFIGPLDIDVVGQSGTYLDRVMNFGWLPIQPFSRSVLWILKKLHLGGLNYGIILILFAFLIRFLTGPLTKKSFQSSQKMQSVQPKLKKIQEKFKKDPQKLNQETVKLYKNEGVNPLGGCLPMLVQMPLLFSLFIVFRSTIEFRGAPFFWWITDLSKPDVLFNLPFYVPIYGSHVGLLPMVLGISMFFSQRLSMATMDSKQKPMMYMMTAFFFLIFNQFPAGLNLYYTAYNILNYFQQRGLKRI